ncbi:MAG: LysM peptidoglycan-binding domain-containing protein, partial [Myxococcota bacterium]
AVGLIDFVTDAGRKIGLFGGRAAADAEAAKEAALAAAALAKTASDAAAKENLHRQMVAADLKAAILSYVAVDGLTVTFDGQTATVGGTAHAQADKEKAVLVAGNTEGVARVDDRLAVVVPEPPAVYHTVVKGDTLSLIAGRYYGVIGLYDGIFVANQPMLRSPDEIYPGQVLRIPPTRPPVHTVAKGETLGTIAKHWYGDAKQFTRIATANGIADPNKIDLGQKLTIPLVDPKVSPPTA